VPLVPNVALEGLGLIVGPCEDPLYGNETGVTVKVTGSGFTTRLTVAVADV
jgi:hypothetical protein